MGVTQNSYIPSAREVGQGRVAPETFKSDTSLALGVLLCVFSLQCVKIYILAGQPS